MNEVPPRMFLFHGYVVSEAYIDNHEMLNAHVCNCRNWAKPDLDPRLFVNKHIMTERGSGPLVNIRADDPDLIPIRPGRLRWPVRMSQQEAEDIGLQVHMSMTMAESRQIYEDRFGKLHEWEQIALFHDYVMFTVLRNERVDLLFAAGLVLPAPTGSLCVGPDDRQIAMYIPVEPGDPDLELIGKFC